MKKFIFEIIQVAVITLGCFGFVLLAISSMPCNPISSSDIEIVTETDESSQETIEEEPIEETPKLVSLGMFKASAYCTENYPHICNDGNANHTATGTVPTPGRTIAVDPKVIPYGTEVIIEGHTFIAEDCGEAITGNEVDICFPLHKSALEFGVQEVEVFVKE